jgi:hypothetical protein
MNEVSGCGTAGACAPVKYLCLQSSHVPVVDRLEPGLEQLTWTRLVRNSRKRALLGVNQTLTMLNRRAIDHGSLNIVDANVVSEHGARVGVGLLNWCAGEASLPARQYG